MTEEEQEKIEMVEIPKIGEKVESFLKQSINSYSKEEKFNLCTILTNMLNATYIQPKFGFKKNKKGERVVTEINGSVTLSQLLPIDNQMVKDKLMEIIKSF